MVLESFGVVIRIVGVAGDPAQRSAASAGLRRSRIVGHKLHHVRELVSSPYRYKAPSSTYILQPQAQLTPFHP